MNRLTFLRAILPLVFLPSAAPAGDGTVPAFPLERSDLELARVARATAPFDRVGRKFAVLGFESGQCEAWAYPLKLFRNFELSFLIGSSTVPVRGADIVRHASVTPEAASLTYTFQSFTVTAVFITPQDEPGALCLLEVNSTEPLTIVCSFLPVLQPMWPAGIGGQYARWDPEMRAYLISEPTRKNNGYLGSPAAEGISYTPAHMLSDQPNQFTITVKDPKAAQGRFIPIVMAGGKGPRDSVKAVYRRLAADPAGCYRRNLEHFRALRRGTLRVRTPDERLNLAFEWAKVAYDGLMVENPDLGTGMVAGLGASGTSGRPGFGWFFGGDAYINSLSMTAYGSFAAVRDAIAFTRRWQREDGKMAHELSQAAGYVDWFKDYPYGYIHGDTSPFYLVAVHEYLLRSGDLGFVRESWPSLRKAYEWSRSTDADGDGLMDNARAGLGALEYGALTDVQSDVYTGAVWVRAAQAMVPLAEAAGEPAFAEQAREYATRSLASFRARFWDDRTKQYAYAFDAKGKHVDIVSPWSAVGLMWDLGEPERSRMTLEKLAGAELTTDWGIRSLSVESRLYEPLNYNYGAVWPFLTGWVAAAHYRHRLPLQAHALLAATAEHTFDNQLGAVTEVFSGSQNVWPQEAVSHQGFCTGGFVLPFVRGLLGLEADAVAKTVSFAPQFPAGWDTVRVENFAVGGCTLDLLYARTPSGIFLYGRAEGGEGFTMAFAPVMVGGGAGTTEAFLDGSARADVTTGEDRSTAVRQPQISFPLRSSFTVEFRFAQPGWEILPPAAGSRTGDPNRGMKIVAVRATPKGIEVTADGPAGETCVLRMKGPGVATTEVPIAFPKGPPGTFVRRTVPLDTR